MASTKPPLGVIPRKIVEEQRRTDLWDAVHRYAKAGVDVPVEWIDEYKELSDRAQKVKKEEDNLSNLIKMIYTSCPCLLPTPKLGGVFNWAWEVNIHKGNEEKDQEVTVEVENVLRLEMEKYTLSHVKKPSVIVIGSLTMEKLIFEMTGRIRGISDKPDRIREYCGVRICESESLPLYDIRIF